MRVKLLVPVRTARTRKRVRYFNRSIIPPGRDLYVVLLFFDNENDMIDACCEDSEDEEPGQVRRHQSINHITCERPVCRVFLQYYLTMRVISSVPVRTARMMISNIAIDN
jgi:hypothetical protein